MSASVVVDASALVELLLRSERAAGVEQAVGTSDLAAPDILDPEVASALRRLERAGQLDAARAASAVDALVAAPVDRVPAAPLLREAWALRANVTIYDALYVVLARRLGCPLVSGDARLARAPGLGVATLLI